MERESIWFWISYKLKYISFHEETGLDKVSVDTDTEMWELIDMFVNKGYLVQ